jgi:hypothetical protein
VTPGPERSIRPLNGPLLPLVGSRTSLNADGQIDGFVDSTGDGT